MAGSGYSGLNPHLKKKKTSIGRKRRFHSFTLTQLANRYDAKVDASNYVKR